MCVVSTCDRSNVAPVQILVSKFSENYVPQRFQNLNLNENKKIICHQKNNFYTTQRPMSLYYVNW